MDDISLLFDSNEWKKHDPNEEVNMEKFLRNLKHPGCEEVDRIGQFFLQFYKLEGKREDVFKKLINLYFLTFGILFMNFGEF